MTMVLFLVADATPDLLVEHAEEDYFLMYLYLLYLHTYNTINIPEV